MSDLAGWFMLPSLAMPSSEGDRDHDDQQPAALSLPQMPGMVELRRE